MSSMASPPVDTDRAIPGVPLSNIIGCSVAFAVVTVRIYTRLCIKGSAGWDDALIVAAIVFAIGYVAAEMVQVYNGHYGHHRIYLTFDQLKIIDQTNLAVNILNPASLFCARASICAFLLRILGTFRTWRYALWMALFLNTSVFVGTSVTYGVVCVPFRHSYDSKYPGTCMNHVHFDDILKIFSALNCIVDFMCATIPFFAMRNVQIDQRTKIGLFTILGCGLVTASCSIGRVTALNFQSKDAPYDLVPLSYWVDAEMYGAIVFASVPAIRQLYTHYRQHKTFSRIKPTYRSNSGPYTGVTNTKKGSMPASIATATKMAMSRAQSHGSEEIARQTDVYIELDDIENGRTCRSNRRDT